MYKKIKVQLVPTLILGLIYVYNIKNVDLISYVESPLKYGYWFTIVLLEMFLLYYLICNIIREYKKKEFLFNITIIIVSILMLVSVPVLRINNKIGYITDILCVHDTFKYFHYYAFGLLMRIV